MSSVGPVLKRSAETTTAGRVPPCSCPRTGSGSTHHTSPRRTLRDGTCMALLLPVLVFEAIRERPIPRRGLSAIFASLRRGQGRVGAIDLIPESVARIAFDRVGGEIAHRSRRLLRHRLERAVAGMGHADQRPRRGSFRHRGDGKPRGLPASTTRMTNDRSNPAREPRGTKESDRLPGATLQGEVREDLADDTRELEAVARAGRGVGHRSVAVDDEVPVGTVRV